MRPARTVLAAVLATGALLMAGCAASTTGGATTTVSVTETATATATVVATVTAEPEATIPGLPADVSGVWCAELDPDDCLDFTQLVIDHPKAFVKTTTADAAAPGATRVLVCLEPDAAGTDCLDDADSLLLEYLPVDLGWDCEAFAASWPTRAFTDCDPDYSSVHDTTRARLLDLYFDQPGQAFEDVPPLYEVSG